MSQTTMEPAVALDRVRELVESAVAGNVFGTPIEQNGVIILPVAKVSGGGGGGGGSGTAPGAAGSGAAHRGAAGSADPDGASPGQSVAPRTGPAGPGMAATGNGGGGGLGLTAKPLGVFVIKRGKVHWRGAVDLNKVIMGGQLVAVAALLTLRAIIRARAARTQS